MVSHSRKRYKVGSSRVLCLWLDPNEWYPRHGGCGVVPVQHRPQRDDNSHREDVLTSTDDSDRVVISHGSLDTRSVRVTDISVKLLELSQDRTDLEALLKVVVLVSIDKLQVLTTVEDKCMVLVIRLTITKNGVTRQLNTELRTTTAILHDLTVTIDKTTYVAHNWRVALIAYASGILSLFIDTFGTRIPHHIAMASLYWSLGGFIICAVVILAVANRFQPSSFVFTDTINAGWSNRGMDVILGIMQSAYGMCTYDSVVHLSEETADAAEQTPRAMVLSVIIGFFTGFGFVLALLFSIQDVSAVVNTAAGLPLLEIFYQATNSHAGAICLCVISLVAQSFSNISLLTEGSRGVYAFARDGAFPFRMNQILEVVHPTLDVPLNALIFSFGVSAVLVAILFGSSTALFTVMSIASPGLYISYLMCVFVYTIKAENKARGYYNLGKWAIWLQIPAIIYLTFCCVFFFFPTTVPVTGSNMNYCVAAFAIMAIFSVSSWFLGARHSYVRDVGVIDGQAVLAEAQANTKPDLCSSADNTDGSIQEKNVGVTSVQ